MINLFMDLCVVADNLGDRDLFPEHVVSSFGLFCIY
jgi:hypothetical protein